MNDTLELGPRSFPIGGDTGIIPRGDGYERFITVIGWNDSDRLAQIAVRIDRLPEDSYAKVSVWTEMAGWQTVVQLPPADYWGQMPGYLRWRRQACLNATSHVIEDLMEAFLKVAPD